MLTAWQHHPRRAVIGNTYGSFGGKLAAATDAILELIGIEHDTR